MNDETIIILVNVGACVLLLAFILYTPKAFRKKKVEHAPVSKHQWMLPIIKDLERQIQISETAREPIDICNWEERIGILISRDDADYIINYYYSNEDKV